MEINWSEVLGNPVWTINHLIHVVYCKFYVLMFDVTSKILDLSSYFYYFTARFHSCYVDGADRSSFRKMSLTERLLSWLHSCDFGSPACMEWCSFGSYWDRGTLFLLLSFSRMCSDCTPRLLRASHAHTQASSALMEICNQFSQQERGASH